MLAHLYKQHLCPFLHYYIFSFFLFFSQDLLDQIQSEVKELERGSEKLESRIKSFLRQYHVIASSTEEIQYKLEDLIRSHKALSTH